MVDFVCILFFVDIPGSIGGTALRELYHMFQVGVNFL